MNTVIQAENLGKKYIISHQKQRYRETLRETMTSMSRSLWQRIRHPLSSNRESVDLEDFWALKDINFEVHEGERMGIIGRNGAGKSTLLKILSRITEPTTGRVRIRGRVSSLLEVGTGFHPELSGRENIFLNGAILGMTRQEIRKKFDEIVAFAEVEQFLDTPVKRYSSGMYVRLAFAVAAHLEPEILIVDEVLAVGDASFQKKCLGKMKNVAKEGRTILFVSHNMGAISALCPTTIILDTGSIAYVGQTSDATQKYLINVKNSAGQSLKERTDRRGNGFVRISDVWIENSKGQRLTTVACGNEVSINLSYKANHTCSFLRFLVGVYDANDQRVLAFDSRINPFSLDSLQPTGIVQCKLTSPLPLSPGQYRMNTAVFSANTLEDHICDVLVFDVIEGDFFGTGQLPHNFWPMFLTANEWRVK
jgi:lipopolysaccharide transport system ATP-binding protein